MECGSRLQTLQTYAWQALQRAEERSYLAQQLEAIPHSQLQAVFTSRLLVDTKGDVPEIARKLLGRYWLNANGLCVSYSAECQRYELRYIARSAAGIVVERVACPADSKLATLLFLVRDAETRQFHALAQHNRSPGAPQLEFDVPYIVSKSSAGDSVKIGELQAYCPLPELMPQVIRQTAAEYLLQLRPLLNLDNTWILSFADRQTLRVKHIDAPEREFLTPWRPSLQQCATEARAVLEQVHQDLLAEWKQGTGLDFSYQGLAPDGCVLLKVTLLKSSEDYDGWEYSQKVPFRKARISTLGEHTWDAIQRDLHQVLQEHSETLQAVTGQWVTPLHITAEQPPQFDVRFCRQQVQLVSLHEVLSGLKLSLNSVADLELVCLHFIIQRIAERWNDKRAGSVTTTMPGVGGLQITGTAAAGFVLRVGRRTRTQTLQNAIAVRGIRDLVGWLDYSRRRQEENERDMNGLIEHLPAIVRYIEDPASGCSYPVRWGLAREGNMEDVGLWVRRRDLDKECNGTAVPLSWENPLQCYHQAQVAIAATLALKECRLGGPVDLNHYKTYGVHVTAFGGYDLRAASLVWPGKTHSISTTLGLESLWRGLLKVQRQRYTEVEKLWKRMLPLRGIYVPDPCMGHWSIAISMDKPILRPLIRDDGSLAICAWRGQHDNMYYKEFPVKSMRQLKVLIQAADWSSSTEPGLEDEKVPYSDFSDSWDNQGLAGRPY